MDSSAICEEDLQESSGSRTRGEATQADLSDSALVSACLEGNALAWNALIARYEGLIYSLALRTGLPAADADDVFQEVCLIWLDHLCDLRDVNRLPGWLAMTTRREAWRRFRCREVARLAEQSLTCLQSENTETIVAPSTELPEAALLSIERRSELQQAMRLLPERCRHLLTLLYCEEPACTYAEAAARLKVPVGSIGPERARSLKRLQKILEDRGFFTL